MVTASRRSADGSALLGRVTLGLGAAFLAAASYMTLSEIVSSSRAPNTGPALEALKRLPSTELEEANNAARAAYQREPLDAEALIGLSRIAEVRGDAEIAERLKLIAGDMTPRDTAVQVEALAILLRRRDFDAVMTRLDGLIRARPQQAQNFFAVAAEIARDPDGANATARMLAQNPPWRAAFVANLIAKGDVDTAYRINSALRGLGAGVDPGELAALIDFHLRQGGIDKAYGIWLASLSPEELKAVRRVYDGGFDHEIRSLRFDWTVTPEEGLSYRTFPRNTASLNQTLQIDFKNFAGGFANLSQMLRLGPARYKLSGEARFEAFQSPTSLVFRVYCGSGGASELIEETPALPQSTQWIAFESAFQVPSDGCNTQLLRLESKITPESAQLTRGQVAIDNIQIEKLPELAP